MDFGGFFLIYPKISGRLWLVIFTPSYPSNLLSSIQSRIYYIILNICLSAIKTNESNNTSLDSSWQGLDLCSEARTGILDSNSPINEYFTQERQLKMEYISFAEWFPLKYKQLWYSQDDGWWISYGHRMTYL